MFRYLLLSIFAFATYFSFAQQDSSLSNHHTDSLIKPTVVGSGKYKSVVYTTGNNTVLSRIEIRDRLLSYEPSAEEYKKFKTARIVAAVSTVAGITSFIIALIANKQHDLPTTRTGAYIGTGFLITEITALVIAPKHFNKSLRLYNKQFL